MTALAGAGPVPVHVLTLGCARNEVDSEELAARLEQGGFALDGSVDTASVVIVNTCGFVEAAKKDSIDAVLELSGSGRPVVAVGCLAERYGAALARELPEATVLGFDDYPEIADRLRDVLAGRAVAAHTPRDRRRLLPLAPVARHAADVVVPGHVPHASRRRLGSGPVAPLKIASGCDRRCAFCAIPSFRGSYISRPPADVLAEARWLVGRGVRELFLVSENTTSYGKDLRDLRLLERLLPQLAALGARVRVSYLQPAELRPSLVDVMTGTPGVVPYFDLSFQHASERVLRRMRRFGSTARFLDLLASIRERCPAAGVRSNVIVGFPGETAADLEELERFLGAARLDAIGVFGFSPEDGTEASTMPGALDPDEVAARASRVGELAAELVAQRAEERLGELVDILVARVRRAPDGWAADGPAEHQGPDVDGLTTVRGAGRAPVPGDLLLGRVVRAAGADLDALVEAS